VAFQYREQRVSGGAAVLSVVFNDSVAQARRFVGQWGQVWPAVADHDGAIANAYGVSSPPMTFLVNPRGIVVGVYAGPATTSQLGAMLASARAGHG
jgi:peroxiredoxin